jgi:N-acetylglucosamine-6-phosphate deacetylase
VSRRSNVVKLKHDQTSGSTFGNLKTLGLVDLHFHGAFGIDCMTASTTELDELSQTLWKQGIAAFCPTTLSSSTQELKRAAVRLGKWIRNVKNPGAYPVGIHLEGPYLNPNACGAHPPSTIRKLDWKELNDLWDGSQKTLKILTIAPEILEYSELKALHKWAKERKILISLGHSKATEEQANVAFKNGFSGITHAWNALHFHQREPGPLGAALGKEKIYLELIIDQVHLSPTVLNWTLQLHPTQSICFISDCLSAGGKPSSRNWQTFGSLKVRLHEGACRLPDGTLAGAGMTLAQSYAKWVCDESRRRKVSIESTLRDTVLHVTQVPFRVLGLPPKALADRQICWQINELQRSMKLIPID